MNPTPRVNLLVGLFIVLTFFSLTFLAYRASSQAELFTHHTPRIITAHFDNISGLRVRAPVRIAGVRVGEIKTISLDPTTYQARVELAISSQISVPIDSRASVLTEGLLGAKYIKITPGFSEESLGLTGEINQTQSAMIIEDLIAQFLFNKAESGGKK